MTEPTAVHIRQVLFASDFSPQSNHAFEAALALARHFGSRLHLLHVVHHTHGEAAARAHLEAFARERATGVEWSVATATGHAGAEIVKHAEREKVDLIVMGTHGRTGVTHAVRGSVAETVMRHAPCLVLAIRMKVELPLEAVPASTQGAPAPGTHPGRGHCLICAQPSEDLVCDACKARVRAEAAYHLSQEEKAGR
jgi:universal stress protein A